MNKLLIIGQLPPPYHGSNVMAGIMIDVLKRKRYDVTFIDKGFSKNISDIGKLTLKKIARIPLLGIEVLIKSLIVKPSLCIYFPAVGKAAFFLDAIYLFLIRKCRIPYVLRFGGKGYNLLKKEGPLWKFIVHSTLSNATAGIVLGNNMKWDVNSHINGKRLINVPSGVPLPSKEPLNRNDGKIWILFLSNLIPSKGPFEVLKAAKIATKNNKNLFFILAGSAKSSFFEKELRSYILNNDLQEIIILPGSVKGEQKENLFRLSDIFVFPTYYEREVFGTVNIEAMSYGLPIISSNEGAIPEIVQDGITGYIVNPKSPDEIAEKILILANDPRLRNKMGDKAKEVFKEKYTLEAHAENLERALGNFLKFAYDDKIRQNRPLKANAMLRTYARK